MKDSEKFKKHIISKISEISGRYSSHQVFNDWVAMMALTISNSLDVFHGKIWQDREQQYINIASKYTKDEIKAFCEMCSALSYLLETEYCDALGSIYMESECGNKHIGQFFTPYHLSYLCARTAIPEDISEENKYIINEPSCGGGGMMIAAAHVLHDRGLNPQRCLRVVAQDLDWNGVYMTYVQLSLLGIDAVVVQGNTLSEPYTGYNITNNRVFRTPKNMGVLL